MIRAAGRAPIRYHCPVGQGGAGTDEPLRSAMLVVLFATPALLPILGDVPVRDPDVWWHLATGRWILAHHAVPHVDPFLAGWAEHPWVAYSWLFDVVVYGLFERLGHAGLTVYATVMSLALVGAIYSLVYRISRHFPIAVVLTALVSVSTWRHQGARTFLLTMTLFACELDLLWQARRTGRYASLLWLVPLFVFWANVHIQFVYGLAMLAIAVVEVVYERSTAVGIGPRRSPDRRAALMIGIFLACCAATLVNPYGWRVYQVVYEYAVQAAPWHYLLELRAPTFRSPLDWVVLALAFGGAFALGGRRVRVFPLLLLAMAVVFSFRAMRDSWMVAMVGAVILADASAGVNVLVVPVRWPSVGAVAARSAAVLAIVASVWMLESAAGPPPEAVIATSYPAGAARFVETSKLEGPLFNHMNWGGYLIWRLPDHPPSIDGRTNVQGDEALDRSMRVWNAARRWQDDPKLAAAGIVIADLTEPLTDRLRTDPRFELVYEDEVAAVFSAGSGH